MLDEAEVALNEGPNGWKYASRWLEDVAARWNCTTGCERRLYMSIDNRIKHASAVVNASQTTMAYI